jgi:L,D-transpeptidase ErfK/SrfK
VLYIEAHPDLEGEEMGQEQRYGVALNLIQKATKEELPEFDQKALNQALKDLDGEPVAIYERVPVLEPQDALPSGEEDTIPDVNQPFPAAPEAGKGSPGGYYQGT